MLCLRLWRLSVFKHQPHTAAHIYSVRIGCGMWPCHKIPVDAAVCGNMNIILAGALAAFVVGLVAVALAPVVKVPAEACFSRHCSP